MGYIKPIIEFITKNTKLILVILLGIAVIFAFSYRDAYQQQKIETQQQIDNIEALKDSVRTVENKLGKVQKEKLALQTDKEQLKTLNEELSEEVEAQKGKVDQLTQLVAELEGDTGSVDSTSDAQQLLFVQSSGLSNYKFTWEKIESGDKWSKVLEGYFVVRADSSYTPKVIENKITKDNINMEIYTGIKSVDGKKTIFVRSTYPNMDFTDINGAILDNNTIQSQKPNRWGIGLTGGYGYSDGFAPFVGIGITYDIITF